MKLARLVAGTMMLCLGLATQAFAQEEKQEGDTIQLASEAVEMEKANVRGTLERYVEALETGNEEQFADLVVHHSDRMFFGIHGDPMIGWDELKGQVVERSTHLEDMQIEPGHQDINVAPSGELAWATALWKVSGMKEGETMETLVRASFVLEQSADGWRIVHFHNSVAPQSEPMEEQGEMKKDDEGQKEGQKGHKGGN